MRVAVTGGSGFIGAHVVDRLIAAGHHVDVIDLRAPERTDVRHWAVDLCDLDGLVRATQGCDAVFHLAAVADVNDAAADPVLATEVNVAGTARVWEACRLNNVKRAVLASTVWVYSGADGDGNDQGMLDEDAAFKLDDAGHLYTSSKLAAELVVQSYHTLYGQEFTILRYGIPYGPGMRDSLVISRFVRMALHGEPITIQGDGSQYRNYVYVEDLADAHVLALRDEGANEVFNLEGPAPITIRHLVECIEQLMERPLAVEYLPARTGDYEGKAISAEKAARVIGWTPRVPFEEGLRRYLTWHVAREQAPRVVAAAATLSPAAGEAPEPAEADAPPARRWALASAGLALPAIVSLAVSGDTSPSARVFAIAGTLFGVATAWAMSRWRGRTIPAVLSAAVLVAAVWLVSQASPGVVSLPLGVLTGVAVGALAPAPFRLRRDTVFLACGAFAALITIAGIDRHLLWWSAALLAIVIATSLDRFWLSLPEAPPARRPSWALAASTLALTVFTASWAGATSPRAAWFGSVVNHGPRSASEVAITFDGARTTSSTQHVLDALSAAHVEATFFENGQAVVAQPAVARAIEQRGHLLASASWNNSGTDWLDPRYHDLRRAQHVFAQQLGVCPTYFRPPHAWHTPLMAQAAHHEGMTMVTWDVRARARKNEDPQTLARRILAKVRPGSIVALDLRGDDPAADTLVQALPLVLQGLRARGLEPVRLDRLLDARGYTGCSADAS